MYLVKAAGRQAFGVGVGRLVRAAVTGARRAYPEDGQSRVCSLWFWGSGVIAAEWEFGRRRGLGKGWSGHGQVFTGDCYA